MTDPDDSFAEHVKQQILDAYGFESMTEVNAGIEAELPGYLAAEAECKARTEAYRTELPDRVREAAARVTELLRTQGMLPDGVEFELAPMDLQADPKWVAQAPEWRSRGEPIVVDYATDRPFSLPTPLDPDVAELAEEQKQAMIERASEMIEQHGRRRGT